MLGIVTCYYLGQSSAERQCKEESFVHNILISLLVGVASLILLILLGFYNKKQGLKSFRSCFQTVYGQVMPTFGLNRPTQSLEQETNANAK